MLRGPVHALGGVRSDVISLSAIRRKIRRKRTIRRKIRRRLGVFRILGHFSHEVIQRGLRAIKLLKVDTADQLADIFTKPLP